MLEELISSCLFMLVHNPLDTLNAAYWLVVSGDLVIVGEQEHESIPIYINSLCMCYQEHSSGAWEVDNM
jgi:hypothetical protein